MDTHFGLEHGNHFLLAKSIFTKFLLVAQPVQTMAFPKKKPYAGRQETDQTGSSRNDNKQRSIIHRLPHDNGCFVNVYDEKSLAQHQLSKSIGDDDIIDPRINTRWPPSIE